MRILRVRHGFQADHSSSSYLFYAVEHPVSAKGQQLAHRFSSRADVDQRTARYQKWGESSLSSDAYQALLSEHYDVMVSESYEMWTLMIALPKTPQLKALLRPFHDVSDEFQRLTVSDWGRLVVEMNLTFSGDGPWLEGGEDVLEYLAELLVKIRGEILQGNVSFLEAVAAFYQPAEEDTDESAAAGAAPGEADDWTKTRLQQECTARGLAFRKSWTKEQLRMALRGTAAGPSAGRVRRPKAAKLSKAARVIVDSLDHT